MNLLTRAALALLAGAFAFWGGWYYRGDQVRTVQAPPIIQTETRTVTQEKVVTKVVREQTKAPDGTLKTVTTTTIAADKTKESAKDKSHQSVAAVLPNRNDWSLGLTWTPRLNREIYKPTGAEIGRRVVGNLWGTASFDWRTHSASVGVRLEF